MKNIESLFLTLSSLSHDSFLDMANTRACRLTKDRSITRQTSTVTTQQISGRKQLIRTLYLLCYTAGLKATLDGCESIKAQSVCLSVCVKLIEFGHIRYVMSVHGMPGKPDKLYYKRTSKNTRRLNEEMYLF